MQYPNFLETVLTLIPMYRLRAIGGSLYIIGTFLMAYNLWRTARAGQFVPDVEVQSAPIARDEHLTGSQDPWGHRWLDLKRTNRAEAVLRPLLSTDTWKQGSELYPIPAIEIANNPMLVQNSGY